MLEDDNTPFDKLREECGVMAVYNHPDAARLTYWGLYSLQHRGQESGGIASADGEHVNVLTRRFSWAAKKLWVESVHIPLERSKTYEPEMIDK